MTARACCPTSSTRVLSIGEIAEHLSGELGRGLDFLASSLRDVPERHRSLRAVCDHSRALLSEEEQGAFVRLSVFRAGFRRAAAAQVANACLPLLSVLVDKSLVRPGPAGRYDVHPILREHAAEKLAGNPQAEAEARDRHSAHFLAFLRDREGALKGAGQIAALAEIGADLDNDWPARGWFCICRFFLAEGAAAVRKGLAILRRLDAQEELGLAVSFVFQGGIAESFAEAELLFHESLAI